MIMDGVSAIQNISKHHPQRGEQTEGYCEASAMQEGVQSCRADIVEEDESGKWQKQNKKSIVAKRLQKVSVGDGVQRALQSTKWALQASEQVQRTFEDWHVRRFVRPTAGIDKIVV